MAKANLKPLFPLIGADHKTWEQLLQNAGESRMERERKQAELVEWHKALSETVHQIEWVYASLESFKIREEEAGRSNERKRRQAEQRLPLRQFLALPPLDEDLPLRKLHLTSRTGAEMRLDVLSFFEAGEGNVMSVNRARTLFQGGGVPKAMWGLYYIRDGERSAGYAWEKPFLDEVFVHVGP